MAKRNKTQIDDTIHKSLQTLQSLSVQFVSYLIEEDAKGKALDKIIATFTRHQAKLISGLLGSAGLAGGVWAAASIWTSSLGLWGSLGYAIGMVTMPAWIPLAGGVAGLTAAGGAIYSVLNLSKNRQHSRQLHAIIGFSKMLIGREQLEEGDEKLLRRFLTAQEVDQERIGQLLSTTPDEAEKLALRHLDSTTRREVARYIFPLVYQEAGIIADADRRRFTRVCSRLQLGDEAAREISQSYRQRLDNQWGYMKQLIESLNYFAGRLGFDGREMELVREELDQLMRFDPRRSAATRRERQLSQLGQSAEHFALDLQGDGQTAEAALMGAYAMAHTATPGRDELSTLSLAFSDLLDAANPDKKARKKLDDSRQKVDELYSATRQQIEKMAQADAKKGKK